MKNFRKGKYGILFLLSGLALCAGGGACSKGNTEEKTEVAEPRYIENFVVPQTATCGQGSVYKLPTYYAVDNYGNKIKAEPRIVGASNEDVQIVDGSITVTQEIGTFYYIVYTASVENDSLSRLLTVMVCKDASSPVLTVPEREFVVESGASVNLAAHYSVSDDSGDNYTMHFDATHNGKEIEYTGQSFIAENGRYEISLYATDYSGNQSQTETISIVARDSWVVADFEAQCDFDRVKYNGVGTRGNYKLTRTTERVHSGEYAAKIEATPGKEKWVIITKTNGYTNGARLFPSYTMFGAYIWLEAKDGAKEITLNYKSTTYENHWTKSSIGYMSFYDDGVLLDGSGDCDGTNSITLPTGKWLFLEGDVKEYSSTSFSFTEKDDKAFTMYLDDLHAAVSATGESNRLDYDIYGKESITLDLDEVVYGKVREGLSTANYSRALYEVEDSDGNAVSLSGSSVTLGEGTYQVYLTNIDGIRAGYYATVEVTSKLHNYVWFDTKGNSVFAMPDGVVGTAYPVPTATADGIQTSVAVYKGQTQIACTDGKFTPDEAGNYSIRYTLSNGNGEPEIFDVPVHIVDTAEWDKELLLDGNLLNSVAGTAQVGKTVELPAAAYSGGTGVVSSEIRVQDEVVTDGKWMPAGTGTYTIIYTVSDYIGKQEITKTVTVNYDAHPVLYGAGNLPQAYISGYAYTVEGVSAKQYTADGETDVPVQLYWVYEGEEHPFDGVSFRPTVDANGDTITIKYKAGDYTQVSNEIHVIVPTQNDKLCIEHYFVSTSENVSVAAGEKDITVSVSGAVDNAELFFVNKLLANGFVFDFGVDTANDNLRSLTVRLTDSVNKNNFVDLTVTRSDLKENECKLLVNGKRAGTFAGSFDKESNALLTIGYNNYTLDVRDSSGSVCNLAELIDGFHGFESNCVYMSLFIETKGETTLSLRQLCGQTLRDMRLDGMVPSYQSEQELTLLYKINDTITIPRLFAVDVLDPNATVRITLTKPDHTPLKPSYAVSSDGITLQDVSADRAFSIAGDVYGTYRLTIVLSDGSYNVRNILLSVKVIDEVPPVITVSGSVPETAKVGATVSIPAATATDNVSGQTQVEVYICSPYAQYEKLNGTEFVPAVSGTYKIVYYTRDTEGNSAKLEYDLVVTD